MTVVVNILLISDKFVIAKSIEKRLIRMGYRIGGSVSRLNESIRMLSENSYDVVLLDIDLKGETDLLVWARKIKIKFNTPFVYLTRYLTKNLVEKDQGLTFLNTVQEPYEARDLQKTIELVRIQFKSEQKFKDLIRDKELLLKEIHHRVKNNFQIIISLLNLKSQNIEDDRVREVFREIQDRIRSMAMIHEHLYKTGDFKEIHFGDYIQNLLEKLIKSYRVDPNKISFELKIMDIILDLDRAIPCGLIVHELVSNSLKHAFPQNREVKGRIFISLLRKKSEIELIFQDNGVGFSKGFNMKKTKSLGLHLVDMLVTNQLHGSIRMDRNRGLKFIIIFRLPD